MKIIIIALFIFTAFYASADKKPYIIKGTSGLKDGIAILDVYSKNADTVQILDGKFQFTGSTEGPRYQSIQVLPGRPARIILEPGEITVSYTKEEGYRIGGTPNNKRLQFMDEQIKPYYDKVADLWKKYNAAEGEERARLFNECEKARDEKDAKARELIMADPNYSGFLMMLPTYRDETAGVVNKYLEQFKAFTDDESFKSFADFCRGAAQTDFGVKAPDWTRPDEKGKMVTLSSFQGKYVLIDFWYSGCHWCRKMTPHLTKVYGDLKKKGLEIVSVSVDPVKDEDKWRKAMEEDAAPWLQVWDAEKKLPGEYGVLAYPTMFLLDKEGKVVEKIIGFREEPALRDMFAKYIH